MRVALTGPDGDTGTLGEALRALGVATASHPLLVEEASSDFANAAARLRSGEGGPFAAVALSSPRAVDALLAAVDGAPLQFARAFAVGETTARRALEAGLVARREDCVVGEGPGADGLLRRLRVDGGDLRGVRVLLPGSARARPELAEGLRALGAHIQEIALYTVTPATDLASRVQALRDGGVDAAVIASPSAAAALVEGAAGEGLPRLFALGPTTAAAMRELGLTVAGEAPRPTASGLMAVIARERDMQEESSARFPVARPRRLRRSAALRDMLRETRLSADQLVAPMFLADATERGGARVPIPSMPGIERVNVDAAVEDARRLRGLGVRAVLLFGVLPPAAKDAAGSGAWDEEGVVCRAIRALKREVPDLQVWADICLCEYTDHGHCGPLRADGTVDNDAALPPLSRAAVACARSGADAVCPSDMMDGRVAAIRGALDGAGLEETLLVSYAVKYASAFYGPFRDAADSAPRHGDRRAYQMDPGNAREALREAALDEAEGADILMVKPALAYLDIVRRVRERTHLPVAAYNVSGEYAMLKAAAAQGWIDGERVMMETLLSMRRAGADLLVTYHAAEAAEVLARS